MLDQIRQRMARWISPRNESDTFLLSSQAAIDYFSADSLAGRVVTPESAARAIPVHACCALIAGGIVSMPLRILQRKPWQGGYTQAAADTHDYWWLLNESANDETPSAFLWEQVIKAMLLHGEAFVRIVRRRGTNIATELVFCQPRSVNVVRKWDAARQRNVISAYSITDGEHRVVVDPFDMLHFRGEQTSGDAPKSQILESAREAIGITLAIEEYCARIFSNGGTPRVSLEFPAGITLKDEQLNQLRNTWVQRYGGAENTALPMVLTNGGKVSKLSFTAEETQMLEARKFQVIDIARAFRVPPFMIGETESTSAWGSGIEQMSQGFIRYTLARHITAIEQEITRKLFFTTKFFVDFDEEALARGDMAALGNWFRQAVGGSQGPGILTVNEVRARLHVAPVDGGDQLFNPKGESNEPKPTPSAAAAESDDA